MKTPNCPILGLGTDIIDIARIKNAIQRHPRFVERIFTLEEQKYCYCYNDPFPRFAGRFAAKEAVLKALGKGLTKELGWKDVAVVNEASGKPTVVWTPRLSALCQEWEIFLTISHCRTFATATAIIAANK